jgi:uncharacterized membrane protein YidH (DUF202 family)
MIEVISVGLVVIGVVSMALAYNKWRQKDKTERILIPLLSIGGAVEILVGGLWLYTAVSLTA